MPIYEYRCPHCGHVFERLTFKTSWTAKGLECPACGGTGATRVVSSVSTLRNSASGDGSSCGSSPSRGFS